MSCNAKQEPKYDSQPAKPQTIEELSKKKKPAISRGPADILGDTTGNWKRGRLIK